MDASPELLPREHFRDCIFYPRNPSKFFLFSGITLKILLISFGVMLYNGKISNYISVFILL